MGTPDPLVRIEAATLAGGDNNQDRYAYGDGWAFVLDGATSFSDIPPVHDGGWYAERLKRALVAQLDSRPRAATPELVAAAICVASADHDPASQGPCPTSTIALARWDSVAVELYSLGDSVAAAVTPAGRVVALLEDSRIDRIGSTVRETYRQRLAEGRGFDDDHRECLAQLQVMQRGARNLADGYWIAGQSPEAALHGLRERTSRAGANLVLMTDGLTALRTPQRVCREIALTSALPAYLAQLNRLASCFHDGGWTVAD